MYAFLYTNNQMYTHARAQHYLSTNCLHECTNVCVHMCVMVCNWDTNPILSNIQLDIGDDNRG